MTLTTLPLSVLRTAPARLQEPLLALFPHGLQHQARRNAFHAVGLASAGRRDRQEANEAVALAVAARERMTAAR